MDKNKYKGLKKFAGKVIWCLPNIFVIPEVSKSEIQTAVIKRAILFQDKFNLEWELGGFKLTTKDDFHYSGVFNYEDDGTITTGKISSKLFKGRDELFLIGTWTEEGYVYSFIVELKEVQKFPDEK